MKKIYTTIYAWTILFAAAQTFTLYGGDWKITEVTKIADIQKGNGPIVVEFYRGRCPHCQIMVPRYEEVAKQHNPRVKFYRVTVDNWALAQEVTKLLSTAANPINLTGVPTFVFVDSAGNVSQMVGQMEIGALNNKVTRLQ